MRADRLLSIMLLLQLHRRMTARELAERMEVSERTIQRDMEALSAAGVPVTAERGAGGGWALVEGYRTNLTGLNEAEVQALFIAGPSKVLADLQLGKASDAAFIKLLASLPSVSRRGAEYVLERIHVDVSGWGAEAETVPHLSTLQDAIWRERKLRIVYGRGGEGYEEMVERTVDPLGLVAKGSAWYLVAAAHGEPRSYRASRVKSAELMDEACVRPEGFDLAAFWEKSASVFKMSLPRYRATLRVRRTILPRLRYAGRFARVERVGEPDMDGWVEVSMRFQFEAEACEYALSFGSQVEVVEPVELRGKVVEMAEGVIAFYAQRAAGA
ncbi:MAG: YafY family transcriptional regulator [Rubrivivax sp.]|nr:YafY family transcriptional regulator [Pyrinomonadaceae bacterium]